MKSVSQFKFIKILVLFSLTLTLYFVSCSKSSTTPPPVTNKTSLQEKIDSGTYYHTYTTEGTKPGQYTVGAKATLNTAIASATTILNDATSTQSVLDNAAANMQAAINNYHSAYIQEIAAANLIAYWKFNGNANDSSGNGHNGVVTKGHVYFGGGTPSLTSDRFGNANRAYHFDQGGNIEVPYATTLNPSSMSISLWVKRDTTTRLVNNNDRYMIAMSRWNGWKFQTQPSLPFYTVHAVRTANTPVDSTYYDRDDAGTALNSPTTWYHLVVTFTSGEEDFYINGSLVKSWTNVPGTPINISANPINITIGSDLPVSKYTTVDDGTGRFFVNWGGFWTGDMDDVMFYNIALSGPQVQSIFNDQNTQ